MKQQFQPVCSSIQYTYENGRMVESNATYELPLEQLSKAYTQAMRDKDEKRQTAIRYQYKKLAEALQQPYDVELLKGEK